VGQHENVPEYVQVGDRAMAVVLDAAARMVGVAMYDDYKQAENARELCHEMCHLAMDQYGFVPAVFYGARSAAQVLEQAGVEINFQEGRIFRDPESGLWTWSMSKPEALSKDQGIALRAGARLIVGAVDLIGMKGPEDATPEEAANYRVWVGDTAAEEYPCAALQGVIALYGVICLTVGRHLLGGGR